LGKVRAAELSGLYPAHAESTYLTGRNIGDEYRYVLDRKYQRKFPGNMAERPALLLNPWAVRSTESGEQLGEAGEGFQRRGEPVPSKTTADHFASVGSTLGRAGNSDFADLDFLAEASAVL